MDGEILETLWAPLNHISGSTRSMTAAHRREVLDSHLNDNNWKKLVRIGMGSHYLPNTRSRVDGRPRVVPKVYEG